MSLPVQRRKFPDFESRIFSRWRNSNNATSLKEELIILKSLSIWSTSMPTNDVQQFSKMSL
uniref:Uncharacterized protein n=1 Tax=Solanum tuberosum TaxID=4113 RepID=M1ASW6_SOLTU